MEEIIERQLLIRGRASAAFSTIEKALAGRTMCRPDLDSISVILKLFNLIAFMAYSFSARIALTAVIIEK